MEITHPEELAAMKKRSLLPNYSSGKLTDLRGDTTGVRANADRKGYRD
jgi:hypothetical protein